MDIQAYCRKYGVSRAKAEHVAREQERFKVDIAQPGTQLFDNAWGDKVKRDAETKHKQEQESQAMKQELAEKREFDKTHDPLHPKFL